MKRIQQILAGVLAVQIIIGVIVFWPRSAGGVAGKAVLPDFKVDDVVALTLTNDQLQALKLTKVNGEWGLADNEQYPVKSESVTALLEKLTRLNTSSLVANTEASQRQLQVASDTFVRRLEIEMQDGTKQIIYLGSSPRYTATHFRMGGQKETYLTTEITTWEVNPTVTSWIDTVYGKVDQSTLTQVVLENANGTFTFVKEGEAWQMLGLAEGDTAAAGKVTEIVTKASQVTILRPLGKTEKPEYGMSAPLATVTLTAADKTYTLKVGAQDPTDSSYIVSSSESPYYVAVASYGVSPLVNNTYESFLETPATPTTTP
ncbi:MAG: DUF4340 domain-containing protein [Anaerolineae bacterium]|nr:DUF4340 domain-containing protein [Anaerolineae bacterium]